MGDASFGKYRLIAELGHGGMADVFLAVVAGPAGSGFSKLTVVKRLRQNLADEPEFVEMLVDEARISARLNHPNVVQTNEVGSVNNHYFIAMEYLDGQPLHRIQHRAMQKAQRAIAQGSTVPPDGPDSLILPTDPFPKECQYLVLIETLAGLHHAHALADYDGSPLGIVHRDVTPHNVFVTYEGQTKVVDFGIAKAAGRASETRQGVVKGKIRYMAPEQAVGQQVDRRADVFSVGVMLWEAATGRRLWKDMDDLVIVQSLVGGTMPSSPRAFDTSVPEAIDAICRKALAHNPDDRYATADLMRADLETYLAETGQLVSARRKLGAVVSDLFKDKRAEIRSVIEKQLAQIKAQNISAPDANPVPLLLDSGPLSLISSGSAARITAPSQPSVDSAASLTDAATELYTSSKKKDTRVSSSRMTLLAGVSALAVATAVFATYRGRAHEDVKPPIAATAEITSALVRVKISTTPDSARVSIDGAPVATPADAKMPRDSQEHVVRIEAPGFEPHVETVRFENDVAMAVVLKTQPLAAPSASHSAASSATPAATPPRWTPPPPPVAPTRSTPPVTVATTPPVASVAPSGKPKPPPLIDPKEEMWPVPAPKR